jgi:acetylornithine deacetylase/succinyl-diaminopimelate desuccinylase-like protein
MRTEKDFIPRNAMIPDARRFTDVADYILRFAPIDLNKKQFATIHGDDEHIGIENIGQCVVFYKDLAGRF